MDRVGVDDVNAEPQVLEGEVLEADARLQKPASPYPARQLLFFLGIEIVILLFVALLLLSVLGVLLWNLLHNLTL